MKNTHNTWWFTLLLILWVIGFLLVLLTGVFKIVLLELQDTKDMDYYIKAKSASEAGEEIAMLQLKKHGFWYDWEIDSTDKTGKSIILSWNPDDWSQFHQNKDVIFWYTIDSKTDSYAWSIEASDFIVIPLFYKEDTETGDTMIGGTKQPILTINSSNKSDFAWNIIWEEWGISGTWEFNKDTSVKNKKISDPDSLGRQKFTLENTNVASFLSESDTNYLTILNTWGTPISYSLTTNDRESFTKPVTTVYSSAKIGEIKQNIKLEIDNSKYFDVLKYSIYDT